MLRSPLSSPLRSPLSSPLAARRGGGAGAYNPIPVFGSDLVTWYGNSVDDLWRAQGATPTLYQDNSGATSVTALEQTVGRINDLSGNGYHLTQSTLANRALLSARYNQLLATATLSTQSITTIAASQRLTFSGAGSITLSGTATGTYSAGTHTITTTAGTLTLTVSGSVTNADLRLSAYPASWPQYQRVTSASDYDTVGFPARLVMDGVDDSYSSGVIQYGGTQQLTTFSALMKASDTAFAVLFESGNNNLGGYSLLAPAATASNTIGYRSRLLDAEITTITATAPAPAVRLAVTESNRGSGVMRLRLNGSVSAQNNTIETGTFLDFSLFVGRRNNASNPFNGDIFSLPMIVKRLATPEEITASEKAFGKAIGVLQ